MPEYQSPRTYSRQQRYYMDRATVRKAAARPTLLAADRMEDRQLWSAGLTRAIALRTALADGTDVTAYTHAADLVEILLELQTRGLQLQLFPESP